MSPDEITALLAQFDGPAGYAADGALLAVNPAFSAWAPSYAHARLDLKPDGAWLMAAGRTPLPVRAEPFGAGLLVLATADGARAALDAVITSVVRRLDRVTNALDTSLAGALRERPSEGTSAAIREALATVEELRGLRRQVLGLSPGVSQPTPQAVNLSLLVEEALAAMTGPLPVHFESTAAACVVTAVREKMFFGMAALAAVLSRGATPGAPIRVVVRSRPLSGQVLVHAPAALGLEGLDLDPARAAMEAAGGRLLVTDDGVVVEFPLYETASPTSTATPHGTVLLVDDDPNALAMMGAILRRDGFAVIEADNGVAASTILRTHGRKLAALVTDAVLPGRSGVELAAEARRWLPRLPVLIVTGHDEDLVGAAGHPILRKPFAVNQFRDAVHACFSARR